MYTPDTLSGAAGTIYGVILNHHDTIEQMGDALNNAPYKAPAKAPVLYIKPGTSRAVGAEAITVPGNTDALEIGATIGIVMGRAAGRLSAANAASAIGGYITVADLSIPHDSYYRPAVKEKCFDQSCVMSAAITPAAAVANIGSTVVSTYINDKLAAEYSLTDLVRDVPTLLADVTEYMTLHSGDVLLVGVKWRAPQGKRGDRITVSASGIGDIRFTLA